MHFDSEAENCRLREIRTGSEEIFDGVVLHVQRDTVKLPNGSEAVREVIRHIGAVCVIPVMENGDVIMERQFRYPLDRVILRHLDEDEFLDVCTVPLKDLVEDVMAGKISDAKTQVCVLKAARLLGL